MNSVIENYRQLSDIAGLMRETATLGDWDQLVALEQQYSQQLASMKALDLVPLSASLHLQKVALINKILADDAAIREKAHPRMAELQRFIQSARSEQRIKHAYSSPS